MGVEDLNPYTGELLPTQSAATHVSHGTWMVKINIGKRRM
jgi:hypothetical protein